MKRQRVEFRVFGTQDAYNGELQALMYAVTNWPQNTKGEIKIDNAAVVQLGQTAREWGVRELRKCPQPALTRMYQQIQKIKQTRDKAEIEIIKVKGHSEIEGNEKADKRAKKGVSAEKTYWREEDLQPYKNKIDIHTNQTTIQSNYRQQIKKLHLEKRAAEAQQNRNETWKKLNLGTYNKTISHEFLKNKKISKGVTRTIIKARTDTLSHAKNMVERGCKNIQNTNCPMCGQVEDTQHILIDCKYYDKTRQKIEDEIYEKLKKRVGGKVTQLTLKLKLPIWFNRRGIITDQTLSLLHGAVGYIPKKAITALVMLDKELKDPKQKYEKVNNTLIKIHHILCKRAHQIWKQRNEAWKEAAETKKKERKKELENLPTGIPI